MAYLISLLACRISFSVPFTVLAWQQALLQNEYQALGSEDMSYRIDSNRDAPAQHRTALQYSYHPSKIIP
jgi:hypothetical protein